MFDWVGRVSCGRRRGYFEGGVFKLGRERVFFNSFLGEVGRLAVEVSW